MIRIYRYFHSTLAITKFQIITFPSVVQILNSHIKPNLNSVTMLKDSIHLMFKSELEDSFTMRNQVEILNNNKFQ